MGVRDKTVEIGSPAMRATAVPRPRSIGIDSDAVGKPPLQTTGTGAVSLPMRVETIDGVGGSGAHLDTRGREEGDIFMGVGKQWLVVVVFSLVGVMGCTSTNTERISDDERQASRVTGEAATDTIATAEGLTWDVPGVFKPVVPSSSMRIAEYELPSAEEKVRPANLALFFFGRGVGGRAPANLERWIRQFRQPDRSDSRQRASVDSFEVASGLTVTTVRLTGIYEPPSMNDKPGFDFPGWALYGAVVEGEGGPWFFKAVGPRAVMEQHRGALEELYRGVRPSS
jgi:hypothetical protein